MPCVAHIAIIPRMVSKSDPHVGDKIFSMIHEAFVPGQDASKDGYLVLLRHGQTAWSQTGQYTGRTDLPLTAEGGNQARAVGKRLTLAFPAGFDSNCIFASPLRRAQETARLAGFDRCIDMPDIMEWDYGHAEGRRQADVSAEIGADWQLWTDGPQTLRNDKSQNWRADLPSGEHIMVRVTDGETLNQVAVRTRRVVSKVDPMVRAGKHVILIAHAHVLRILVTQWLDLEPYKAQLLRMDTAHYGVLGIYQGKRVLKQWNV